MFVIHTGVEFPTTGEWVMSPQPNDFVVCLNNESGAFPEYDRIAYVISLGAQSEKDADGKYETHVDVQSLWTVDGKVPKDSIPSTPETRILLDSAVEKLGLALDQWGTELTEEQQQDFWEMTQPSARSRIIDALSSILGSAKGEQ